MSETDRSEVEVELALRRTKAEQRARRQMIAASHRRVQVHRIDRGLAELRDNAKVALAYALIPLLYRVAAWWNRVRHG